MSEGARILATHYEKMLRGLAEIDPLNPEPRYAAVFAELDTWEDQQPQVAAAIKDVAGLQGLPYSSFKREVRRIAIEHELVDPSFRRLPRKLYFTLIRRGSALRNILLASNIGVAPTRDFGQTKRR